MSLVLLPFTLSPGKEIKVRGSTPFDDEARFSINLCSGYDYDSDTALHFNPRFDQQQVVRNHFQDGSWGSEEHDGDFPFVQGEEYEVRIVVEDSEFQIFVNNSHFCNFAHRLAVDSARDVYIAGDTTVESLSFKDPNEDREGLHRIPFRLRGGKDIRIQGFAPPEADRFSINLCAGTDTSSDTALHFNVRFDEEKVVRNIFQDDWGEEETDGDFPFSQGEQYDVKIVVTDSEYQIHVNGSHFCNFEHRLPPDSANNVYIAGDTVVKDVCFSDSVHPVPFYLNDGKEVTIKGFTHPDATSFSINLCAGSDLLSDTALHFNPRFEQEQVVRNHFQDDWGGEENEGGFPFAQGEPYEVKIMTRDNVFQIYVNGSHFCNFDHRIPSEGVHNVYIQGDTTVKDVSFQNQSPVRNPGVPFNSPIPGALRPGRRIFISGRPSSSPERFTVNLMTGRRLEEGDLALHFDARFNFCGDENATIRTHRRDDEYGPEEREEDAFPFAPDEPFNMVIEVSRADYSITVNNRHHSTFEHRLRPLQAVDHINIKGDVQLDHVRIH